MTLSKLATITFGFLCAIVCGLILGAAIGRIVAWMVTIVALAVGAMG